MRPVPRALLVGMVERRHRHPELPRIAAHLVEREQTGIAIEGSVLHRFGHDRTGVLLEAHGEAQHLAAPERLPAPGEIAGERVVHEVQDLAVGSAPAPPGLLDRPVDVAPILRRGLALADVRAIDGEVRHDGLQRIAQALHRVVARAPVPFGDALERVGEDVQLTRQQRLDHRVLGRQHHVPERPPIADEVAIEQVPGALAGGIDEETVDQAREIVPRRAGNLPVRSQRLVMRENLLDHDVESPPSVRIAMRGVRPCERLQLAAVAPGIEQAVDVVESDALHAAFPDHATEQAVCGVEERAVLHANAGELVDVEEAPVVDLVGADPPEGQPVVLALEQRVQRPEALRIAGGAVECSGRVGHEPGRLGMAGTERAEIGLERRHLAVRFLAPPGRPVGATKITCDPLEGGLGPVGTGPPGSEAAPDHGGVRAGAQRQPVVVIPDAERALLGSEPEGQLAARQDDAVVVPEDGKQHPAPQPRLRGHPVDVEVVAVGRRPAPLEDVQPPGVVRLADPHVVGNEIENQPHRAGAQGIAEAYEVVPVADLRVESVVIGDVVAVLAAGARLQEGRGIDVADAERVEIGNGVEGVPEREVGTQLEAIGRARERQPARCPRRSFGTGARAARRRGGRGLVEIRRHPAPAGAASEKLTNHGGSA